MDNDFTQWSACPTLWVIASNDSWFRWVEVREKEREREYTHNQPLTHPLTRLTLLNFAQSTTPRLLPKFHSNELNTLRALLTQWAFDESVWTRLSVKRTTSELSTRLSLALLSFGRWPSFSSHRSLGEVRVPSTSFSKYVVVRDSLFAPDRRRSTRPVSREVLPLYTAKTVSLIASTSYLRG